MSKIEQLKYILKEMCLDDDVKYLEILDFLKKRNVIETDDIIANTTIIKINDVIKELIPRYDKQYQELRIIGRGGFGDVFVSQYYLDKKIYAVKKIPISEEDLEYFEDYLSEILILSRLEHKNIVRYYTSWAEAYKKDTKNPLEERMITDSDLLPIEYSTFKNLSHSNSSVDMVTPIISLYLQMELCKPFSLHDMIHTTNIPESIKIIKEIVQGVKYLHGKNIIHRDIKPKNILFSLETNTVKLADFGLSCLVDSHASTKSSRGTYLYIDPHSASNVKSVDIYSIGVVITELLCKFKTQMERIETLKKLKKYNVPQYLDETIQKVIRKCISPNINERYDILELEEIIDKINE